MSRIGVFCYLGSGHLNPMSALGRKLAEHGHSVIVFHQANARAAVRAAGLEFALLPNMTAQQKLPRLVGWRAILSLPGQEPMISHAVEIMREAPQAIRNSRIDVLVIDQNDVGAATVAENLGIPFVTVSIVPPLYLDSAVPPYFWGWAPRDGWFGRARNRVCNFIVNASTIRLRRILNRQRRIWELKPLRHINDIFSCCLIISQLPDTFDFPNQRRVFHTGPFCDRAARPRVFFPWDRLAGKPLVYASFGTVRNTDIRLFKTLITASRGLGIQLVISLGGGPISPDQFSVPDDDDTIIVDYAPQLDIIQAASVVVTHGGINTTLESLSSGVPLVVIPITDDQPGVAARVARTGAGLYVRHGKRRPSVIRAALERVLFDSQYQRAAKALQVEITTFDGAARAAKTIEDNLLRALSKATTRPSVCR